MGKGGVGEFGLGSTCLWSAALSLVFCKGGGRWSSCRAALCVVPLLCASATPYLWFICSLSLITHSLLFLSHHTTPSPPITSHTPQLLVLDEADEMLSMNFTEQIYNCYRYLPPDCQVSSN